jgi:hypothetical protein
MQTHCENGVEVTEFVKATRVIVTCGSEWEGRYGGNLRLKLRLCREDKMNCRLVQDEVE